MHEQRYRWGSHHLRAVEGAGGVGREAIFAYDLRAHISRDYTRGLNPVLNFLRILETLLRILETLLHDS